MKKIPIYNINMSFYIFFVIVFLMSYSIESFLDYDINITEIALIMTLPHFLISFMIKKEVSILKPDFFLMFFISYIFIIELTLGSDIMSILMLIVGSFIPYYFGRIINTNSFRKVETVIITIGLFVIIIVNYKMLEVGFNTRGGGIFNESVIALGEVFGITALLLIGRSLIKNEKKYLLFASMIVFTMLAVLGARGSLFSLVISILLLIYYHNNNISFSLKIKKIMLGCMSIVTLVVIANTIELLQYFPVIQRFSLDSLLKDPSIYGNSQFLGRFDLYSMSIDSFFLNPLFGNGFGAVYAHNIFLEILSAYGLIGLTLFLIWLFSVLNIYNIRTVKIHSSIWVIFAIFIFLLVYRLSSFSLYAHKWLFFFSGILVKNINEIRKSELKTI